MDLSKALDSVNSDLLLTKLNGHGLNLDTLHLIRRSLMETSENERNNSFSDWKKLSWSTSRVSPGAFTF